MDDVNSPYLSPDMAQMKTTPPQYHARMKHVPPMTNDEHTERVTAACLRAGMAPSRMVDALALDGWDRRHAQTLVNLMCREALP